jgi:hypothetical protein
VELSGTRVSYRKNHSKPAAPAVSPDEMFEVLLTCPPDEDRVHGKLSVFGLGDRAGSAKSNRLRKEVESLCRKSITQEAIVNSVLEKVVEIYRPVLATVHGDFDSGEGLRVSIEAIYGDSGPCEVESSHLQWRMR